MDNTELYAMFWKLAAVVAIVGIISVAGCEARTNQVYADAVQEMVKQGASPMEAACSLYASDSMITRCIVIASKRN